MDSIKSICFDLRYIFSILLIEAKYDFSAFTPLKQICSLLIFLENHFCLSSVWQKLKWFFAPTLRFLLTPFGTIILNQLLGLLLGKLFYCAMQDFLTSIYFSPVHRILRPISKVYCSLGQWQTFH